MKDAKSRRKTQFEAWWEVGFFRVSLVKDES